MRQARRSPSAKILSDTFGVMRDPAPVDAPQLSDSASSTGAETGRRLIVVGVDRSEPSRKALRWAVDEASLRHADVHVVHCYWAYPMLLAGVTPGTADASEILRSFIVETVGDRTDVEIKPVPIQGRQASVALIDEASGADLLVVGSRGEGGFSGLLLGSVSQQCSHHAPCPLVVVRDG